MIVTCNLKTRSSFLCQRCAKVFFISRYNHLMKGFIIMMIFHFSLTSIRWFFVSTYYLESRRLFYKISFSIILILSATRSNSKSFSFSNRCK